MIGKWEIVKIVEEVSRRGATSVGLQFPAGLMRYADTVAKSIEQECGIEVLVSGKESYGACDVADMPVDLVVNYGHAPIPYLDDGSTLFLELSREADLDTLFNLVHERLGDSVALVASIEYVPLLPSLRKMLKDVGIEAKIAEGSSRIAYPGQVLGCDFSAADVEGVDTVLYLGTGNFHPLGIAISTGKRVIVLDPELKEVRELRELADRMLRRRHAAIQLAKDGQRFGIIVSSKRGQNRLALAEGLKDLVESSGKEAHILLMDNVDPASLASFSFDIYVNTACPRIAIDDYDLFDKPIITPQELEIALGKRRWEEYAMDEIRGPPKSDREVSGE